MKGHAGDLYAICWHPTKPDVFISAAETGRVFVWDAKDTVLLRSGQAGGVLRTTTRPAFNTGTL